MTPHERLNTAMNDRRLELRMTWNDLAKASGISDVTLRAIRRGDNEPSSLTSRRIEDALHWMHGSIAAVLRGGEPTLIDIERPRNALYEELAAEVAEQRRSNEEMRRLLDEQKQRGDELERLMREYFARQGEGDEGDASDHGIA